MKRFHGCWSFGSSLYSGFGVGKTSTNMVDKGLIDRRVAIAKVVEVNADESYAQITNILRQEKPVNNLRLYIPPSAASNQTPTFKEGIIEDGAPALLLSPGIKLIRQARLLLPQGDRQPLTVISYQLSVISFIPWVTVPPPIGPLCVSGEQRVVGVPPIEATANP